MTTLILLRFKYITENVPSPDITRCSAAQTITHPAARSLCDSWASAIAERPCCRVRYSFCHK